MINNKKFEKAARSRSQLAFCMAIIFHLAVIAGVIYYAEAKELMPDFIMELFSEPAESAPQASVP